MLDPAVDPRVPVFSVLRRRIALITGFFLGASAVAAIVHATHRSEPPPPAPAPAPAQISITVPPPLVVTIERTEAAPIAAARADAALGCPALTRPDLPIGKRADLDQVVTTANEKVRVVAAAGAPVLAAATGGRLHVSEDDGATWRVEQVDSESFAVAPDGTVYSVGADGLDVFVRGGEWARRKPPTEPGGKDRVGVLNTTVVWIHDTDLYTSIDRGRTWNKLATPETPWQAADQPAFAYRGSLYQVQHYTDMCGIDDTYVDRLDARGTQASDIFHNHYDAGEPVLAASTDVDTTWTWTQTCRNPDAEVPPQPCEKLPARRLAMLEVGVLVPVEGARALAKYGQSLVELCDGGARQVYRSYPFDAVAAVDWVGRPISVASDGALYRWSPVHGWRKLTTILPPDSNSLD